MDKDKQEDIHKKFTHHERQFVYLPLHVLRNATNIDDLVLPKIAKGKPKFVSKAVKQIHEQMAKQHGRWLSELDNLRFIETVLFEDENIPDEPIVNKTETTKTTPRSAHEREAEPKAVASTSADNAKSKPTAKPSVDENRRVTRAMSIDQTPPNLTRELRKRKVNLVFISRNL